MKCASGNELDRTETQSIVFIFYVQWFFFLNVVPSRLLCFKNCTYNLIYSDYIDNRKNVFLMLNRLFKKYISLNINAQS